MLKPITVFFWLTCILALNQSGLCQDTTSKRLHIPTGGLQFSIIDHPAYAGRETAIMQGNLSAQWPGSDFQRESFTLASHYHLEFSSRLQGGSGIFYSRENGLFSNNGKVGAAASVMVINKTQLKISVGGSGQWQWRTLDSDALSFNDMIDPRSGFVIPTSEPLEGDLTANRTSWSAGIFGTWRKWWLGTSFHHLNQPGWSLTNGNNPQKLESLISIGHRFEHNGSSLIPTLNVSQNQLGWRFSPGFTYLLDQKWMFGFDLHRLDEFRFKAGLGGILPVRAAIFLGLPALEYGTRLGSVRSVGLNFSINFLN